MILKEFKKNIFKKIDEYSEVEPWFTDDEDLQAKFTDAFNEAVRFVFYGKSNKKIWNIFQEPDLNLFKNEQHVYTHHKDDIVIENEEATAYYFEVCDAATILIQTKINGEWQGEEDAKIISNLPVTDNETVFNQYRGAVNGAGIRITFKGSYYYKFRNIALYSEKFSSVENIPPYSLWAQHDIPKNMYQIIRVYHDTEEGKELCEYKVEGGKLKLPVDKIGRFEIESNFFPDMISEETDNETEIDIPIDCIYPVVSKCAAILTQEGSEYSEHVADSEQYMQMLDDSRSRSRVSVKKQVEF